MDTFRKKLYGKSKIELKELSEASLKNMKQDKPSTPSERLKETLQELLQTEAFQFNS